MPYDDNGDAYDREEAEEADAFRKLMWAVGAAVACIVAIVLIAPLAGCEPEPEPDDSVALVLDTGDAAQMHAYGLPSKSDVLHWHVFGEWGYVDCDGNIRMYAELPGEGWRWDSLYEIKWRKAFQH